jgi:hypothetical protein
MFMIQSLEPKFLEIIKSDEELLRLLDIVNTLNLPDSFIAAGAVRNLVWDTLHDKSSRTPLKDVDVVFFDSANVDPKRDLDLRNKLRGIDASVNWDVVNQARSHIMTPSRKSASSTASGIAYWSETPTCVGVRRNNSGTFTICAPHGLHDLMNLVVRPVPKPWKDVALYNSRISEKNWKSIWPKLSIVSTS